MAAFAAGAALLLLVLQLVGSYRRDQGMKWFDVVLESRAEQPYQAIFMGTSRVAAGVDPRTFDSVVESRSGQRFKTINLGMGYTRMAEYFFALRKIRDSKPGALRGADVFIEAPRGLPEYATWDDDWIVLDGTEPLARYMAPGDLPRFLLHSGTPFVHKVTIAFRVLFGYRESYTRLHDHALGAISGHLVARSRTDLKAVGGILTDSSGIRAVRAAALATAKGAASDTTPKVGYGSTILKQVVDLVRAAGGNVYFFDMPVSEIQAAALTTPQRLRERALFEGELRTWNIPMLRTRFQSTNADYPDYWHMSSTRSLEFTRLLAEEFLAARTDTSKR